MFQQKNDKIFKDPLNVLGIAYDILLVCYDASGRDHDKMLCNITFKDDNTTGIFSSDYVVYSVYLVWLLYLTTYVQECSYIQWLYV